ncbi:MAG: hypothetical protein ACJA1A_002997 [Saprospiraceae bacterium]|jgi:hypothetical protein|tara:strand:+ start:1256 stop:1669 length:414 start_codon:yes stop_codon:yes gene_type:complete
MKNFILSAAVLFTICTMKETVLAQGSISKFEISFKVPKETQVHKVKGAQVTINHEEQYSNFNIFREQLEGAGVLSFDGKSVGNTVVGETLKAGVRLDDVKIKSKEANKTITLRGVTIKSIEKKGNRLLSEIEYLSVQ